VRPTPGRIALANSVRGALRSFRGGGRGRAAAATVAAVSAAALATGAAFFVAAVLEAAAKALPRIPGIRPEFLVERALRAGFLAGGFLLLLGALTTGISMLVLSAELPSLRALPLPHAWIFRRRLLGTVGAASAPFVLLALPVLGVAAARSLRPGVALVGGLAALLALVLVAGLTGSAGALLLVRYVRPRRALLLSGLVSALALSASLIGVREVHPERLFDPIAALDLLERLGGAPPPAPLLDPVAHVARGLTRALFGDMRGLLAPAVALGAAALLFPAAARLLAPAHLRALDEAIASPPAGAAARRRPVPSPGAALARAEVATLFRDASTPAQISSLVSVFLLQLLNLVALPSGDAATRDVLAGLETGLALFLVSALSLRFVYPAVSSDGRGALLLRTLPLSPGRHLAVRYLVRGAAAAMAGLLLAGANVLVLRPPAATAGAAVLVALAGSLALPALHLGLGALFPRYGAPNAISVALGPGGLFALVLSTALSLGAAAAVSGELRLLAGTLAGLRLERTPLLLGEGAAAAALALVPLVLGARSLGTSDLSGG
jgi:ABC-2 type transport system permease protein